MISISLQLQLIFVFNVRISEITDFLEFPSRYSDSELNRIGMNTGLPTYLDHALTEENHYPLGAKEYVIINAPRIFQTVLRLVGPILQETLDRITTFGSARDEWKTHLLQRISADQLPPQFGGTRKK